MKLSRSFFTTALWPLALLFLFSARAVKAIPPLTGQKKITKTMGSGRYDNVCAGAQTKNGDMWFGTSTDGAFRYNGRYFVNFTTKDGLPTNTVSAIMQDKDGGVWLVCKTGVCRYDGESFTTIPIGTLNNGGFSTGIPIADNGRGGMVATRILQDRTGKIWLGTNQGIYLYDGRRFAALPDDHPLSENGKNRGMIQCMMEDRKGNIWFSTWFAGVGMYDGKTLTTYKPDGEVWFSGLMEDKDGDIWIGRRSKGVCRYDGKTFTNIHQNGLLDSSCIYGMVQDKRGDIWFATEVDDMTERDISGGVWRYDGKAFKNFTPKDGLTDYNVFCITTDKAGNLWFGTRNKGLSRYDGKTFTRFSE